jgi:hypothetical protein
LPACAADCLLAAFQPWSVEDTGAAFRLLLLKARSGMDKDRAAAIAVRAEQIRQASAEYLWICCGIKPPPPLPDKPVVTDTDVDPEQLRLRPLNRAAPTTRQRP